MIIPPLSCQEKNLTNLQIQKEYPAAMLWGTFIIYQDGLFILLTFLLKIGRFLPIGGTTFATFSRSFPQIFYNSFNTLDPCHGRGF